MIRSTQINTFHLSCAARCGSCGAPLDAGTEVVRDPDCPWPTCLNCAARTSTLPPLRVMGAGGASVRRALERDVANQLDKHLSGRGCVVLHDRCIPVAARSTWPSRGASSIDHLIVGPGGVTVIAMNDWKGPVRLSQRGAPFSRATALVIDAGDRDDLVGGVRRQAAYVTAALDRAGLSVDVRGALCFTQADRLPWTRRRMEDVLIDRPRRIARLARRGGLLDETGVELVARAVAQAFPPA